MIPVTHDEASAALKRLIASAYNDSSREQATFHIPARMTDDDILLVRYVREQREAEAARVLAERGEG